MASVTNAEKQQILCFNLQMVAVPTGFLSERVLKVLSSRGGRVLKGVPMPIGMPLKMGDIFLILCLLCASVISWTAIKQTRNKAKYCIISVNGKDAYKLLLSNPQKVKVNGPLGESIVEISDTGARMLYSPCPLKMCMHQGVIEKSGQIIVCVPNHIIIRIIGEKEVDAITW